MPAVLPVTVIMPQRFLRPQVSNSFEHSALFLAKVRKRGHLVQQFAANDIPLYWISALICGVAKLRKVFDALNMPIHLMDAKSVHRAMQYRHYKIAPESIRYRRVKRAVGLEHCQKVGHGSAVH